jgi:predicted ATP-grasp superfamily ATP-dependent carboligase
MIPPKVMVVGTTPDYVKKLYEAYPERTCFAVDSCFKGDRLLEALDPSLVLFTNLDDVQEIRHDVERFLSGSRVQVEGVACFDCESLVAASEVALHIGRPFPCREAVLRVRSKFHSKHIWAEAGIPSPKAALASGLEETLAFFRAGGSAIVLKPVSGSGSELTFVCGTEEDITGSVDILKRQLPKRKFSPLFKTLPSLCGEDPVDPCKTWVAESHVPGPEFSCDFFLEKDCVTVLRQTGKVKARGQTFGSVLAYVFPAHYPKGFSFQGLCELLKRAAYSLGFSWGHFMADFIVCDGEVVILEITPRPGGDSIPDLVWLATGKDLLGLHLDFVSGRHQRGDGIPSPSGSFASINLYAPQNGIIRHLDPSPLLGLLGVRAFFPKKVVGDRIILPPESYDHRLLGYCVVSLEEGMDVVSLAADLQSLLDVSIEL